MWMGVCVCELLVLRVNYINQYCDLIMPRLFNCSDSDFANAGTEYISMHYSKTKNACLWWGK